MPDLTYTARRIARVVRFTPGITRQGVADRLGLAPTTVNPLVTRLVETGVVTESPRTDRPPRRGRPERLLRFSGDADTLGVMLWSHETLTLALATFDGEVVWRETSAADAHPTSAAVLAAADDLIAAGLAERGIAKPYCLVLGMPGPYERGVGFARDDTHGAVDAVSGWFDGDPLPVLSSKVEMPVIVVNDANLAALGETRDGVARGGHCVFCLTVRGQSIGSGITIGGDLYEGSRGFAGEIAHVKVDDEATEPCACGSRGCLSRVMAGRMRAALAPHLAAPFAYADLLRLLETGDDVATAALEDAGSLIGRVLATLSAFVNPDVVVVDAGSPAASEAVLRGARSQLNESAPPFARSGLTLRASELGGEAALRGAIHVARAAVSRPPAR